MDSVPVRVRGSQPDTKNETPVNNRGTQPKKTSFKPKRWMVVTLLALLLIGGGVGSWLWMSSQNANAIDSSKYQAVFFTSGQVYFGKLEKQNDNYMKLTHVFYIQAQSNTTNSQNPQDANKAQASNIQLTKLGDEIHGPEDAMIISKDQILFFENLKSDGKVADTITKYYAKPN